MRRTLTMLMIASVCIPLGSALPGVQMTVPVDEIGMAGAAVDAGPLSATSPLLLVPGVKVANPTSMGPSSFDTTSTDAALAVDAGVWIRTSGTQAGAPIPLLPDGTLFLGMGTFNDDSGFGSRFANNILLLERAPVRAATLSARESPDARTDDTFSNGPSLGSLTPGAQDDTVTTESASDANSPGASHTFAQSAAALARPLVVTGTIAAAATIGLSLLSVLGLALYHRIRSSGTLDNDKRRSIFEAVCEKPGMGIQEVARIASVSYSTATYHLERLSSAGMLVMTPDGNKLRYYKNGGTFSEAERRVLPILQNPEASRVFEAIVNRPGTYRSEIAQELGVTTTTINWHLRRLNDAGLVEEERKGRNAFLYPSLDGQNTLRALTEKLCDTQRDVATMARRCTGVATGA